MQIKELPSSSTLASNDVLVKETNGGTTQKITGAEFAGQVKNLGGLLGTDDVVNNLNSSSSTAPLAAAQGKALNDAKANASDIAIIIDGNQTTHTGGVAIGEFVRVRNSTISGITDGLYTAAQAIPANTAIDSTYLTAVDGGGLNALNNQIVELTEYSTGEVAIGKWHDGKILYRNRITITAANNTDVYSSYVGNINMKNYYGTCSNGDFIFLLNYDNHAGNYVKTFYHDTNHNFGVKNYGYGTCTYEIFYEYTK